LKKDEKQAFYAGKSPSEEKKDLLPPRNGVGSGAQKNLPSQGALVV